MNALLPDNWEAALAPVFPEGAKDLGIAVVGAGAIVNAAHLPAYRKAGLKVLGVYDVDPARAEATRQQFQLPGTYRTFEDLLADPRVLIVDIAVPSRVQYGLLEQALAAGKHVLCQKPLALSRDELTRIMRLVSGHPECKVAVNQQMRWSPVISSLSRLLERGALGTPMMASIEVSVHTDWRQWPWLLAEPYLISLFNTIHLIDSFRFLFGTPHRVYARGARLAEQPARGETQLLLSLEYDLPFIGFIHDHHNNDSPDRYATVRCEGTDGVAKGTIGIWENYPVGQPDTFEWWSRTADPSYIHRPIIHSGWVPDAFQGPMADLMTAIIEHRQPSISVEDNAKTLDTIFAAIESMERGQVVGVTPSRGT